jgi:hypothetical protein
MVQDYSPHFDYHLMSFDGFIIDMVNVDAVLLELDGIVIDSKAEYTLKLNKAKRLLTTLGD